MRLESNARSREDELLQLWLIKTRAILYDVLMSVLVRMPRTRE